MATKAGGTRPFPAVVIVSILFAVCVFPAQGWVAQGLPRFAGLATFNPGLTVLDIPVRLPITIDLILVPGLFLLAYFVVLLIEAISRGVPVGRELTHRLGSLFAGAFLFLLCLTAGGLITFGTRTWLPPRVLKSVESLGVNADLNTGFGPVHLNGNLFSLLALLAGLGLFIVRIKKAPDARRTVQLTREQRMTPYQRLLQERREQRVKAKVEQTLQKRPAGQSQTLCSNQPLLSLQPEAVNYRPM
jgi:hypothetical protein